MSTVAKKPMFGFVLVVAGAGVCVVILLLVFRAATETTREEAKAAAPVVESPEEKKERAEREAELKELAEQQLAARIARARVLNRIKRVQDNLVAYDSEVKRWEKDVLSLLTNSTGRKIATSDEVAASYQAIVKRVTIDPSWSKQMRKDLESLRKLVEPEDDAKGGESTYSPGEAMQAELATIDDAVTRSLGTIADARLDVESLEYGSSPAPITLEDKLAELDRQARDSRTARIKQAELAEYERGTKELAEAKAKLIEAENATAVKAVEQEVDDEIKKKRLMAVKENREMLVLIAPLTGHGKKQPGAKNSTLDRGPVSYSKLATGGFLGGEGESDESVMAALEIFANFMFRKDFNDRQTWTFNGIWSFGKAYIRLPERDQENLRAVQTFVREHGSDLVELGLLAP